MPLRIHGPARHDCQPQQRHLELDAVGRRHGQRHRDDHGDEFRRRQGGGGLQYAIQWASVEAKRNLRRERLSTRFLTQIAWCGPWDRP